MNDYYRPLVRLKSLTSTRDPHLLWPPSTAYPDKSKGERFEAAPRIWRAGPRSLPGRDIDRQCGDCRFRDACDARFAELNKNTTSGKATGYFVTAFHRADGRMLWEIKLPGMDEPLMDGLSVARDGSILVRLLGGGLARIGTDAAGTPAE